MDLSLVIPLYNEEESLIELYDWIKKTIEREGLSYEVIFVNDGSNDGSAKVLAKLAAQDPRVKVIGFRRNHGKSPDNSI